MRNHSNVFYIFNRDSGFKPVEQAAACRNEFGLDLFRYNGDIYEGRTGTKLIMEITLPKLNEFISMNGGLPKINELIEDHVSKWGESPRYTRPYERKKDIFPSYSPKENMNSAKTNSAREVYTDSQDENDMEP